MKFTIDRKKWARGSVSALVTTKGTMCCLGFYSAACGIDTEIMLELSAPSSLMRLPGVETKTDKLDWLVCSEEDDVDDSKAAVSLIEANDHSGMSDEEREQLITKLFAENGDEVEFIN